MGNEGQRINLDWIYHHNLDRTLEITSHCLVIIAKKGYKTSTNRLKGQAILCVDFGHSQMRKYKFSSRLTRTSESEFSAQ